MKIIPEHTNPLNQGEKNINSTHSLAKRKCDLLSKRVINTALALPPAVKTGCVAGGLQISTSAPPSTFSGQPSARTGKGTAGWVTLSLQDPWAPFFSVLIHGFSIRDTGHVSHRRILASLQTTGEAQESVCRPCPHGVHVGRRLPTSPTVEGQPMTGKVTRVKIQQWLLCLM